MSEAIQAGRTPEIIAAEIRALSGQVLGSIIEIGRRFTEAKELIPYGSFGAWVDGTGYSLSTANNFMRIFREYGGQTSLFGSEAESQTLGKLSYTKALALLAVPAEEREQAAVELDAEHISTRELEKAIKERDEAKKKADGLLQQYAGMAAAYNKEKAARETAIEKAAELEKQCGLLTEQVKELEERPVEVAVQEPDPAEVEKAVAEAVAQEKERAMAEMDALRKREKEERDKLAGELRAVEEKLKDASAKAKDAGAGIQAEADRLRAEAESLKKQLAMSGEALIEFKLRFSMWQAAYVQMKTALEKVPEEQAGKCREAVAAVIAGWQA